MMEFPLGMQPCANEVCTVCDGPAIMRVAAFEYWEPMCMRCFLWYARALEEATEPGALCALLEGTKP